MLQFQLSDKKQQITFINTFFFSRHRRSEHHMPWTEIVFRKHVAGLGDNKIPTNRQKID